MPLWITFQCIFPTNAICKIKYKLFLELYFGGECIVQLLSSGTTDNWMLTEKYFRNPLSGPNKSNKILPSESKTHVPIISKVYFVNSKKHTVCPQKRDLFPGCYNCLRILFEEWNKKWWKKVTGKTAPSLPVFEGQGFRNRRWQSWLFLWSLYYFLINSESG